jgi:hypothetical protein
MIFPLSKRGCIFSFFPKSEGYEGKSEGNKRLAFTCNSFIFIFIKVKVKE